MQPQQDIRPPAVAGQFYPASADALRAAIDDAFLSPLGPGALPTVGVGPRRLAGVIVPHAGYVYSAQAAAWAYAEVARDGRPQAVVLLGVNHRGVSTTMALSPATGWQTPLGVLPVATALGERLRALEPALRLDAHAHAREHSLEVQAPFLQYLFGEIPVLPILIGHAPVSAVLQLGHALAALQREADVLLIASTDFSHYVSQAEAERFDRPALEKILEINPIGMIEVVREQGISMCGVLPVAALLTAAQESGATQATLLHYHTSGDASGDYQHVVGYGAVALYR